MEAPEKIYIDNSACEFDDYWSNNKRIEYIRRDVFVKKACEGIGHLLSGYIIRNFHFGDSYDIDTLCEDFRKYMEE